MRLVCIVVSFWIEELLTCIFIANATHTPNLVSQSSRLQPSPTQQASMAQHSTSSNPSRRNSYLAPTLETVSSSMSMSCCTLTDLSSLIRAILNMLGHGSTVPWISIHPMIKLGLHCLTRALRDLRVLIRTCQTHRGT